MLNNVSEQQCPFCGGVLERSDNKSLLRCQYCGREVKIDCNEDIEDGSKSFDHILTNNDFDTLIKGVKKFKARVLDKFVWKPKDFDFCFPVKSKEVNIGKKNKLIVSSLIKKLECDYNYKSGIHKGLSVELMNVLTQIKEIDSENIYVDFIENFATKNSWECADLNRIFCSKELIKISDYVIPFIELKVVKDSKQTSLIINYLVKTNITENEKSKLILFLIKKANGTIGDFEFAIQTLKSLKTDSAVCYNTLKEIVFDIVRSNESLKDVFAVCDTILNCKIEKSQKVFLLEEIFLHKNVKFDDSKCILGLLHWLDNLDEIGYYRMKIKIIRSVFFQYNNGIETTEKKYIFYTSCELASVIDYFYQMKLFRNIEYDLFNIIKEISLKNISKYKLVESLGLLDYLALLPFNNVPKREKNIWVQTLFLSSLTESNNVNEFLNICEFVAYHQSLNFDKFAPVRIVTALSQRLSKLDCSEDFGSIIKYFDASIFWSKFPKERNNIIYTIVREKTERIDNFNNYIELLRVVSGVTSGKSVKFNLTSLLLNNLMPKNLSVEGYVTISKFFENNVERWKFLLSVLINFGDQVYYKLDDVFEIGMQSNDDYLLYLKICEIFAMRNVMAKDKILFDISEIKSGYELPVKFTKEISVNAREEVRFIKLNLCKIGKGSQRFVDKVMAKLVLQANKYGLDTTK